MFACVTTKKIGTSFVNQLNPYNNLCRLTPSVLRMTFAMGTNLLHQANCLRQQLVSVSCGSSASFCCLRQQCFPLGTNLLHQANCLRQQLVSVSCGSSFSCWPATAKKKKVRNGVCDDQNKKLGHKNETVFPEGFKCSLRAQYVSDGLTSSGKPFSTVNRYLPVEVLFGFIENW